MIEFTLDGKRASASEGELLLHAAARNGVFIPTLCHDDKLEPYGGCRMCVVGVEGAPVPVRNAFAHWPELFEKMPA